MIRHRNVGLPLNDFIGPIIRMAVGMVEITAPLSIESLPVAVVKPAFGALLVTAIGLTPLLPPGLLPAPLATVSVTAVAMAADEKEGAALAGSTQPLDKYEFASIGHRSSGDRQPIPDVAR